MIVKSRAFPRKKIILHLIPERIEQLKLLKWARVTWNRRKRKKSKTFIVKENKGHVKRLVIETSTPYGALNALNENHSVDKVHKNFVKLGKE